MLESFGEKSGHHETPPGWLPIQAPGQGGIDGKQQSESDLAWAPAAHAAGRAAPSGYSRRPVWESHPSLQTCGEGE